MTGPSTAAAVRPGVLRKVHRRARRLRARSRLRAANLRRTQAALRRRPCVPRPEAAPPPAAGSGVETVWGAPRTLLWVTVKRDNPTMRDLYGHWWVEAGDESCGWWPRAVPVGLRQLALGTDGVLNGAGLLGRTGTWSRDAQHGQPAAHAFHPVLADPITDEDVAARLRAYAHGYRGGWRWAWTRRAEHGTCRSFQDGLLQAAGLTEGLEHLGEPRQRLPVPVPPPDPAVVGAGPARRRRQPPGAPDRAGDPPAGARRRIERGPQPGELSLLTRRPGARTAAPADA